MERTRLRELTQVWIIQFSLVFKGRNGAYPIKGIDTFELHFLLTGSRQVEMERTRLRELTHHSRDIGSVS